MSTLFPVLEQESTESENNNFCPSPVRVSKNSSKITNYRSKAYRQNSTIVDETKFFRRTKTATDSPWDGVFINPLELIIPTDIKPLGKGFFGEVRVGFYHGEKVACKILYGKSWKNKTENDLFMREISILSELRHSNVINYLGTSIDQNRKIIVMEYMELGTLHDLLIMTSLDFNFLVKIVRDIAEGMNFLHDNKILHRDFNSKNILLTKGYQAKVADFGLSRKKLEDTTTLSYTIGQIPWMAPEVLQISKNYSQKADVYSFGVLLWQMISRQSPCPPGLSYISMAYKVVNEQWRPAIPHNVLPEYVYLIEKSWNQIPVLRTSFSDILEILSGFVTLEVVVDLPKVTPKLETPSQDSIYLEEMDMELYPPTH